MNGNARFRSRTAGRRALTVFAIAAGSLAVAAAAMAFTVWSPAAGVVLEVETVELATIPNHPPAEPLSAELPYPSVPSTDPSPPTTSTTTTSTSTTLPAARIPPSELTINDLDVSELVNPVGLDDEGAMEIPDVSEVGWYLHGAVPGHPGATVLVAHVWWDRTAGPFHRLGALEPGAGVEVGLDDGTTHRYVVVKRTMYDKDSLPSHLWRNTGPETLVLITCGGRFDYDTNRYEQNIVVYAVPSAETPSAETTELLR